MIAYFKKGEAVLIGRHKYRIRGIERTASGDVFYYVKGLTIENIQVVPQVRVKKIHTAAEKKFCASWKKAFLK